MRHIEIQLPALLETKMLAASGNYWWNRKMPKCFMTENPSPELKFLKKSGTNSLSHCGLFFFFGKWK